MRFIVVYNFYNNGSSSRWQVVDTKLGVVANAYDNEAQARQSVLACNVPPPLPYDVKSAEKNYERKVAAQQSAQRCAPLGTGTVR